MKTLSLELQARDTSKTPKALRRDNKVPCVVYGNGVENTILQAEHNVMLKAYTQAGESTVLEINLGNKKVPVLIHDIEFHPVTERIMHVDFYAVNMKKKIETEVPVHYTGESPAVKSLGGVIVTVLDHVTVECLPGDLPHAIDIDISSLANFDDSITVADLKVAAGVTILNDPEQMVTTVQAPRAAIEEETTAAPVSELVAAEKAKEEAKKAEVKSDKSDKDK